MTSEQPTTVATIAEGIARVSWAAHVQEQGLLEAVAVVTEAVQESLREHGRVEVLLDPDDLVAHRVATWSGLQREGVLRGYELRDGSHTDRVVFARLADDPPIHEPGGFRSLLNSFLPRKRAIGQVLIRDHDGRVLMCQLTYKQDWDLPGGVVEVGESPQLAAVREVDEELGLTIQPGGLLLTDWLPPWGGWDDAICLVFDGGTHDAEILANVVVQEREIRSAEFCTPGQVADRAADFTARRVAAALANLGGGPAYAESGERP